MPQRAEMKIISIASGSSGNCTLVSMGDANFLVDCGISMRRIKAALSEEGINPAQLDGIFITHEHSDHISGLAMMSRYFKIPIFAPRTVARHLRYSVAGVEESLNVFPQGESIHCGGVEISFFHTIHDTEESVGYRFCAGHTFAIATDTGIVTPQIMDGLMGADAVIIESNHDIDMLRGGSYPYMLKKRIMSENGHLSNDDCARLATVLAEKGTKYIILAHLSRENNTPEKAFSAVSRAVEGRNAMVYVAPEAEKLTIELGD